MLGDMIRRPPPSLVDVVGSLSQGAEKGAEEADERGDRRPARPRPPQPINWRPHARRVCVTKQRYERSGCIAAITTCGRWRAAKLGRRFMPPGAPVPIDGEGTEA